MSEIEQRLPPPVNANPVHPNAKTTTHVNNGTTTTKTNITSPVCRNCKTQTTPLWRRDETGQVLCNACGLFLKLHGRPRPISLKTDTIKSRNRIKQSNSAKSSSPNTPELKSKDSKSDLMNGRKSPKPKKKTNNPNTSTIDSNSLTALLPANRQRVSSQTPNNTVFPNQMNTFPPRLPNHLSHQVQPLHYPSSTPTQFAPGLQRITSPLLLSTSSSISNARSSNGYGNLSAAAQAAGALENMSNELGPSATFKSSTPNSGSNGVSLINNGTSSIKNDSRVFSTPSSALSAQAYPPPKLPALNSNSSSESNTKSIASPSFGPQFHLQSQKSGPNINKQQPSPNSSEISQLASPVSSATTSLPPIQHVSSMVNKTSLPLFHSNFNSFDHNSNEHSQKGQSFNNIRNSNNSDNSNDNTNNRNNETNNNDSNNDRNGGNGNNQNNERNNNNHEVTLLKTRISELELVNDLYRTRIMELEAMEQAARLRESSMRKRLDEIMNLQEKSTPSFKREGDEQSNLSKKQKLDS